MSIITPKRLEKLDSFRYIPILWNQVIALESWVRELALENLKVANTQTPFLFVSLYIYIYGLTAPSSPLCPLAETERLTDTRPSNVSLEDEPPTGGSLITDWLYPNRRYSSWRSHTWKTDHVRKNFSPFGNLICLFRIRYPRRKDWQYKEGDQ